MRFFKSFLYVWKSMKQRNPPIYFVDRGNPLICVRAIILRELDENQKLILRNWLNGYISDSASN